MKIYCTVVIDTTHFYLCVPCDIPGSIFFALFCCCFQFIVFIHPKGWSSYLEVLIYIFLESFWNSENSNSLGCLEQLFSQLNDPFLSPRKLTVWNNMFQFSLVCYFTTRSTARGQGIHLYNHVAVNIEKVTCGFNVELSVS